ncbi:MAG TPA: hypothetical protein VKA68_01670, partial [bacterium]|nr:hypothetical protein [bacterium]
HPLFTAYEPPTRFPVQSRLEYAGLLSRAGTSHSRRASGHTELRIGRREGIQPNGQLHEIMPVPDVSPVPAAHPARLCTPPPARSVF